MDVKGAREKTKSAFAKLLKMKAKEMSLAGTPPDLVGFRFDDEPVRKPEDRWKDDPGMEGWEPV